MLLLRKSLMCHWLALIIPIQTYRVCTWYNIKDLLTDFLQFFYCLSWQRSKFLQFLDSLTLFQTWVTFLVQVTMHHVIPHVVHLTPSQLQFSYLHLHLFPFSSAHLPMLQFVHHQLAHLVFITSSFTQILWSSRSGYASFALSWPSLSSTPWFSTVKTPCNSLQASPTLKDQVRGLFCPQGCQWSSKLYTWHISQASNNAEVQLFALSYSKSWAVETSL